MTYAELLELARDAAAGLIGAGLPQRGRVAIWAPNGLEWIVAALGVGLAGGVVVPLNTRFKSAEVHEALQRTGCRLVVAQDEFVGLRMAEVVADLPWSGTVVSLGTGTSSLTEWRDLIAAAPSGTGAEVDRRLKRVQPNDESYVQLTSGTTGYPKGVPLRHSALVDTTRVWVSIVGLGPADRYPLTSPFSHIGGHKTGVLASVVAGATAHPYAIVDVATLDAELDAHEVALLQGPPAMFEMLVRHRLEQSRPASVRVVVTGAAVVPVRLIHDVRAHLGAQAVHTAYGLSEATGVCTITRRDDPAEVVATTSGRPIPGVEVRVVDATGRSLPAGEIGEVAVRGDGVMEGYISDPAATAEVIRDGWLHTGDLGLVTPESNLRIVDRLKDMIIVGGFNVYPGEVERALREHPEVETAAVVGVPDERLGELPHAFIVARSTRTNSHDILRWARERLANYKAPRSAELVEALPLNAAGKVDKNELRARSGRLSAGTPPSELAPE